MTCSENRIETQLIINGDWKVSTGNRRYEVRNPARPDQIVGYAAQGNPGDVNFAVESAHQAFPAWASLSYSERSKYLREVDTLLVADKEDLQFRIKLFTREHGKILAESGMEMTRLGDRFLLAASYAERLEQDEKLTGPPFDTIIAKQPRGVVVLIVPWNWPLSILGAKLPQALLAGNTVVVKIAEEAPLAPVLTLKLVADALPKGVINVVTGKPGEMGDALLTHPLVRKIAFTGGIKTGKHVISKSAATLKHVTLELGGNDPAIVLGDAELNADAFQKMAMGTFLTAGQVCMAIKRIYVHRSRYRELIDGLSNVLSHYVIGDGLDPKVTMGPLNNRRQLDFVRELVTEAQEKGAVCNEFGQIADEETFQQGYFHRPTIVTGVDHTMRIVTVEQFGPVVPIISFETEEEAVRMANDTEYGLCSSVWTGDRERGIRIARKFETGYTYLNAHGPMAQDSRAPFGGFKQSGIGRILGFEGLLEFLEYHSISAQSGWLNIG